MADITEIRELARKLNLWNIARGYIDLNDEKLPNIDYIQMILHKELEIRARQKQIKQLSHLTWLYKEQNIILLGKCETGKTSLAVQIGEKAIINGHKTYYAPIDVFIAVAEKKDINPKAGAAFSYMRECNLIIIDDVFYLEPTRSELQAFFIEQLLFLMKQEVSFLLPIVKYLHG